jgi:hypothetical protein
MVSLASASAAPCGSNVATKELDPTRKGLLKLPGSALKIWMCHWMHENLHGESWPSVNTICGETDLCRRTVEPWRSWLVDHGWLEKLGKKPIPNNNGYTPIVTVKDGAKTVEERGLQQWDNGGRTVQQSSDTDAANMEQAETERQDLPSSEILIQQNLRDKGFVLPCGSSVLPFSLPSIVGSSSAPSPSSRTEESGAPARQKTGARQTTTKPTAKPKAAPDGTPYPNGFDSWTNEVRIAWLIEHGLPERKLRLPSHAPDAVLRREASWTPKSDLDDLDDVLCGAEASEEQGETKARSRGEKPELAETVLVDPPDFAAPPAACEYCFAERGEPHHKNCVVRAGREGFRTQVREGVTLSSASGVMIDFSLVVGSQPQELTVSGDINAIDSTTSTIGGQISEQTLTELPLNSRDLFKAAIFAPGVAPTPSSAPVLDENCSPYVTHF